MRPRRRRRSPEVAEREIIAAAHGLLRERPFRELTVDEVMRRTELSRPSFYVHFRDRHHQGADPHERALPEPLARSPETVLRTLGTIWTRTLYGATA